MCWRLPIVPGRFQPSIFGTSELNFCVRNGNRWTLTVINTNYSVNRFELRFLPSLSATSIYYHILLQNASLFSKKIKFFSRQTKSARNSRRARLSLDVDRGALPPVADQAKPGRNSRRASYLRGNIVVMGYCVAVAGLSWIWYNVNRKAATRAF